MTPYDYETFLGVHENTAHKDALTFAREMRLIQFTPPYPCYHCGEPASIAILYGFECIPRCPHCASGIIRAYEPPSEKSYSTQEAACILRVHPKVISKKLKLGEIAGAKNKGVWEIGQAEIDRLLKLRFELNTMAYCSLYDAAKRLNIHYQTLLEWLSKGKISAQRDPLSHGKQYFLALCKIETLLKERCRKESQSP